MNSIGQFTSLSFMLTAAILVTSCSPKKEETKVVAEVDSLYHTFRIDYELNEKVLNFSIATDVPENTPVILTVSKSYYRKGEKSPYATMYFAEEELMVGEFKNIKVELDNEKWINELISTKLEFENTENQFEIERISDSVNIWAAIPYTDNYPNFANDSLGDTEKSFYFPITKELEKLKIFNYKKPIHSY